ncbi:MAG: PEP-CTERM sorting domain-containing protein [Symploca sp. SIO3C6]|uniref:PEP-CTERM sorting domain-containing protein n=1 Tax=Symploca sp. SIO1C4 TaxID=2607765 RepID=A0A6B3N9X2_9CYAN|nr:PEP-CTERM sorting domain-containing protein [Symploca sp. SIO3C6]NER28313.1 PEP-CTERM sorting domain-containing protein [Symploca sp. SIO1C4]NET03506.1 PEP-CTERM sorting domain-containing protein [Symploca sp. SIO2B6]
MTIHMKLISSLSSILTAGGVTLAVTGMPAQAFNLNMTNTSNNGAVNVAPQLTVDVNDIGSGQVEFKFNNTGSVDPASITAVYFGKGSNFSDVFSFDSIVNSSGVKFSDGASPKNPGGGIKWNSGFAADADSPKGFNKNGIDVGESLAIKFDLNSGFSFTDVEDGFASDDLSIAMHVQSIGGSGGFSDWFQSNPPVNPPAVPEPLTFLGSAVALGFGAIFKKEYSKKQNKSKAKA